VNEIEEVWRELSEATDSGAPPARVYRLLGNSAEGVRASVAGMDKTFELLIEVPPCWNDGKRKLPEWYGMRFSILPLELHPRPENYQLALSLRDENQRSIFLAFCNDLVANLEGAKSTEDRNEKIEESIQKWGRFFQKCGIDGLTVHQQSGLFGELTWLDRMIDSGLDLIRVVESWKGCERNFHDFDMSGHVIEVKTTMTKEPQQIIVNNERQLDERNLSSLHLFFVAIRKTNGGGSTLPAKVDLIRKKLTSSPTALLRFEDCMINAGYHEHHTPIYQSHFIISEEVLFEVRDDFPRIIDTPDGVGSLRYGLLISACRSFAADLQCFLASLKEQKI